MGNLTVLDELTNLKWSITALSMVCSGERGSAQKEVAECATRGINERLEDVISRIQEYQDGCKKLTEGYREKLKDMKSNLSKEAELIRIIESIENMRLNIL